MKIVAIIIIIALVVATLVRHCSRTTFIEQRYGPSMWSEGMPAPADTRDFSSDYRTP